MSKIFNAIKKGKLLKDICYVAQGIKTGIDKTGITDKEKSDLSKRDGIFILTEEEIKKIGLNKNDGLIKPLYKKSDINKYFTTETTNQFLVYIDNAVDLKSLEETHKEVYDHLTKYKNLILDIKGKNISNEDNWFRLEKPKEKWFFEGEKIIAPQRSKTFTFAYNNTSWYANTDVYFIKQKDTSISLKYILGLLNSKLYYYWLLNYNDQPKNVITLNQKQLSEIPILISEDKAKFIEIIVNYILCIAQAEENINYHVPNSHIIEIFEDLLDAMIFEIYFPNDFKKSKIEIVKYVERDFTPIEDLEIKNQKENIHEAYQKLREKNNEIRNNIKLMKIELRDLLMPILTA